MSTVHEDPTNSPRANANSKKGGSADANKEAAGTVYDSTGKPSTSATARKTMSATEIIPYAIAGIFGVAAIGAGVVLLSRRRARERALRARVTRMLGSAVMRQIASGLGGIAVGAASAVAKSAISNRLASRSADAREAPSA